MSQEDGQAAKHETLEQRPPLQPEKGGVEHRLLKLSGKKREKRDQLLTSSPGASVRGARGCRATATAAGPTVCAGSTACCHRVLQTQIFHGFTKHTDKSKEEKSSVKD